MSDEAKKRLSWALPRLRFAAKKLKAELGEQVSLKLSVSAVLPDGSGKIGASINLTDFLDDVESLSGADSVEEKELQAEYLLDRMGL